MMLLEAALVLAVSAVVAAGVALFAFSVAPSTVVLFLLGIPSVLVAWAQAEAALDEARRAVRGTAM